MKTIFYSWQSDLPNSTNRGFIGDALEKAAKSITDDEIIIDRDTAGIPGSPSITATIFDKISKADVFVADVSIINKGWNGRKAPNPNVLIELGYAIKALGTERIILVMNEDFGDKTQLPFDLQTNKILLYETQKDKGGSQKVLISKIKSQLELIFQNMESNQDIQPTIIDAIRGQQAGRIGTVREYMKSVFKDLETFYPGDGLLEDKTADSDYDQKIVDALEKTIGVVATFRKVIDEISLYDDQTALKEIFKGFKPILEKFDLPVRSPDGPKHRCMHDYYRFVGNEMFVIMTSILLREQKWDLLKFILEEPIVIDNVNGNTDAVDFRYFSKSTICFYYRKQRLKSDRADLQYDLLIERRSNEIEITPSAVEEYTSADLFLFLKGESGKVNSSDVVGLWLPRSVIHFDMPKFILLAKSKVVAAGIAKALGFEDVQNVQILLSNKIPNLSKLLGSIPMIWHNPITTQHINDIGIK